MKAGREGRRRLRARSISGHNDLAPQISSAGFISSIDAVLSTRTSQGAIAWGISLNTFPSIALQFYRYTKGFMHQKAMLVDDSVSAIGTVNFDNRSFRLNFEITAMITDHDFNTEVEKMFLEDFANSRIMQPDELIEKPFWFRFLVRLARLTVPML